MSPCLLAVYLRRPEKWLLEEEVPGVLIISHQCVLVVRMSELGSCGAVVVDFDGGPEG